MSSYELQTTWSTVLVRVLTTVLVRPRGPRVGSALELHVVYSPTCTRTHNQEDRIETHECIVATPRLVPQVGYLLNCYNNTGGCTVLAFRSIPRL